jgi:hypothetical protein
MAVNPADVISLGFQLLDLYDRYQAARAELADAKDDTLAELDAKIDAAFTRIAEKKAATDEALDRAAQR